MMAQTVSNDRDRNGGFALFAVLSFMLIAAAVATPFLTGARTRALIARNVAFELKDRLAVRGLISIAAMRLIERARQSDSDLPRSVSCAFDGVDVKFDFQNHAGLIDLNIGSQELLTLGFRALGRSELEAELLAQTVVEFRTVASNRASTSLAPVRGGFKHLQFEAVSELQDFTDPSGRDFRDAASIFTVHNGAGTIQAEEAPDTLKTVIKALPASNAVFIVQGRAAATTASVQVLVRREGKPSVQGVAIARSKEASNGLTFLSPIKVSYVGENLDAVDASLSCDEFFGPKLAAAVAQLVGG